MGRGKRGSWYVIKSISDLLKGEIRGNRVDD
jgi:hypothetical protein